MDIELQLNTIVSSINEIKNKMATKEDIKLIRRDMRKMNFGIEAILEDIKMLDDRTRPMVKIKNS